MVAQADATRATKPEPSKAWKRTILSHAPPSMLLAHVLKTWTRRSTCRAYSYGLLPNLTSAGASEEPKPANSLPPPPPELPLTEDGEVDVVALRRQRRTDWKRRQGVSHSSG